MDSSEEFNKSIVKNISDHSLLEIDEKQTYLTKKYIEPISDNVLELVSAIRNYYDKLVFKKIKTFDKKSKIYKEYSKYPEWFCLQIRDSVLQILEWEIKEKYKRYEPISSLRQFIKHWWILKWAWWIQNNIHFHNWIQLWNYFLDVANDTVDTTKSKIELSLLSHSGFKNIDSVEEFWNIVELYWNRKVYPNIYFPRLAPFCPIITIDEKWDIFIPDLCTALFSKNILNSFELSYKFIFNSKYSERPLPQECISEIQKKFSYHINLHNYKKNNAFICDSFNNTWNFEEAKKWFDFYKKVLSLEDKNAISFFISCAIKTRDNFNNSFITAIPI